MVPLVFTIAMPRVFDLQSRSDLAALESLTAIRGKIDSLTASMRLANSEVIRRDLDRLYAVTDQGEGLTGIVGFASGILGGACIAVLYLNSLRNRSIAVRANVGSGLVILILLTVNLIAVRYARVEASTTFTSSTDRLGALMSRIQLAAIASNDESLATQLIQFAGNTTATTEDGATALHLAADRGMTKLATELARSRKAEIDAKDANGRTPLMLAAASARPEIVLVLVKAKADVQARDENELTPLHLAAEARRTDIVRLLLDAGADINARDNTGRTALSVAYAQSDDELFAALIDRGAHVGASEEGARLAHDATAEAVKAIERSRDDDPDAGKDETEQLRQLLIQGADPNARMEGVGTPLHRVARAVASLPRSSQRALALGRVAKALLDAGANASDDGGVGRVPYDVTHAARFGHADRVRQYCQDDPKALSIQGLYGESALAIAVETNQSEIVRVLLEYGADKGAWLGAGRSPIETAVLNSTDEVALMLLKNGFATPDTKSPLGGPLHIAAKDGRIDLLEPMIAAGYRVEVKDSRGNTPLHLASETGKVDFARALVERGADPLTWNNSGETAVSLAEKGGFKELYSYFKRQTQTSSAS